VKDATVTLSPEERCHSVKDAQDNFHDKGLDEVRSRRGSIEEMRLACSRGRGVVGGACARRRFHQDRIYQTFSVPDAAIGIDASKRI